MEPITIKYCFRFQDRKEDVYLLKLDADTMESIGPVPDDLPYWTRLSICQCGNCPLKADVVERCPAAVNMVDIVENFQQLLSYDKTVVIVRTGERVIYSRTTIQRGVCSMMGLLMASSACPHMGFFKPMARFHLPFSNNAETIWRATTSYLMIQYFQKQDGLTPDLTFEGLAKIYGDIQKVNIAFAQRLRTACQNDSMVNAIILLDMYAQSMPSAISESLEHLRHLFTPHLAHDRALKKKMANTPKPKKSGARKHEKK